MLMNSYQDAQEWTGMGGNFRVDQKMRGQTLVVDQKVEASFRIEPRIGRQAFKTDKPKNAIRLLSKPLYPIFVLISWLKIQLFYIVPKKMKTKT
jgi:hypothetical protein